MSQRYHRILFLLVQYEDSRVNPPKYGIVQESRLVPPPIGEIGELYEGKLVYVGILSGSRRSKLLSMSEDYQTLQKELKELEENTSTFENHQKGKNFDELENTIKSLQKTLESYRQTISKSRERRTDPFNNNSTPSTSATVRIRSNTNEPSSTNQINESNNHSDYVSPPELPNRLIDIRQSLTDLSRHVRYLEDRLYTKSELKLKKVKHKNRRVLVTPTSSSSSEESYRVSPDLVDSKEKCERYVNNRSFQRTSSMVKNGKPIENVDFEEDKVPEETPKRNRIKRRIVPTSSESCDEGDTVRIGPGRTEVSKHVMSQLDWTSHTLATRKLLTAVFPRKVLATHSLTGKSSPAFANKPAKLCLDPVRVQDIIVTVSKNCQVKENLVRNAITTKCADENKMYRTREAKKKQNKGKKENCDPRNKSDTANTSSSTTNNGISP